MTKEKDANIIAEAYDSIRNKSQIKETVDPNDVPSAILHLIGGLGVYALYKIQEFINNKIAEKEKANNGSLPGTKLNNSGEPSEPNEINAPISSSLRKSQETLNKGKTYL